MHLTARHIFFTFALLAIAPAAHAAGIQGTTCNFPDLSGMTPVTLTSGASPANGSGGDIPGGRWELETARYGSSPLPITGNATGALALEAIGPTSGNGSLALNVTITSPAAYQLDETGAGPYVASGTVLDFQNDCGSATTLSAAEYSIDTSGPEPVMTLWGTIQITDPFPMSILVETGFVLVEPAAADDPVFEDRFEGP